MNDRIGDGEGDVRRLRREPRLALFQPTEMSDGAGLRRAHLLDVSATGALVYAADAPPKGSEVAIGVTGAMMVATVMWVDDRRFGVSWRDPMTRDQVDGVVAAQRAFVAEASARLAARG